MWYRRHSQQKFAVIPANPGEGRGRAGIQERGRSLYSRFSLRLIRPKPCGGFAGMTKLDRKTFPFNKEWNQTLYATKQVRRIFVEEADEIVVAAVYTHYYAGCSCRQGGHT